MKKLIITIVLASAFNVNASIRSFSNDEGCMIKQKTTKKSIQYQILTSKRQIPTNINLSLDYEYLLGDNGFCDDAIFYDEEGYLTGVKIKCTKAFLDLETLALDNRRPTLSRLKYEYFNFNSSQKIRINCENLQEIR